MTTRKLLKLEFADIITAIANVKELDGAALAEIIETTPGIAQEILDGNPTEIPFDRLVIFTLRLGYDVKMHIYPSEKSPGKTDINFTI